MTASGLTYELLTMALVTSLQGDSLVVFSTMIGTYLFAMGCGSFVSRYVRGPFSIILIQTGYGIGFLGGLSTTLLWMLFAWGSGFYLTAYLLLFLVGSLVGLQLPLLMRRLKETLKFKELVSRVLALDYGGALLVSVAFPLILVPYLGLRYSALIFGLLNVAASLGYAVAFDREGRWNPLKFEGGVLLALLSAVTFYTGPLEQATEQSLYAEPIIFSKSTPYQRVVVTSSARTTRLYLNNNLQFSSGDEYRYHEALVVPALRSVENPRSVLILGGGDGLAAKLLLQDPRVEKITLVDLDPTVTRLFRTHPMLSKLNGGSLSSDKVRVINADAFKWVEENGETFDLAVVDFPDPSSFSVGKLYTTYFYRHLAARLNPGGAIVVQSSSPLKARRSFWCIARTLEEAGLAVKPYHAQVPSFGEWGFCLAQAGNRPALQPSRISTRYVTEQLMPTLFVFPPDMERLEVLPNTLFDQQLVRYFREDWAQQVY